MNDDLDDEDFAELLDLVEADADGRLHFEGVPAEVDIFQADDNPPARIITDDGVFER
jgi:hypothetical protein